MHDKHFKEDGKRLLAKILKSDTELPNKETIYPYYMKGFYFFNGKLYVAVDNTTGNCWVEEFYNSEDAISWLKGEFEVSEKALNQETKLLGGLSHHFNRIERKLTSKMDKATDKTCWFYDPTKQNHCKNLKPLPNSCKSCKFYIPKGDPRHAELMKQHESWWRDHLNYITRFHK